MSSVLRPWVEELSMMQQSVLIAAVRGPDGVAKEHPSKKLFRWLRRCVLFSAMDKRELTTPYDGGGGSFTGPSIPNRWDVKGDDWEPHMDELVRTYLRSVDELPHHFQLHFMHAAEILGYKFPDERIRAWWKKTYHRIVADAHLDPESEERMDFRLGDNEKQWRECEREASVGGAA